MKITCEHAGRTVSITTSDDDISAEEFIRECRYLALAVSFTIEQWTTAIHEEFSESLEF